MPDPSVTVQVTVVTPNGKVPGALFVTLATEQLSAVVAVPNATLNALHVPFAFTVTFAGAVIVGFVLSFIVTVCVAVAVFPEPSVTVHVTVVVPNGKVAGALFVTLATVQLSAVVAVPKVTVVATQLLSADAVTFAGAVIVGFVLSITVIVWVAVVLFPAASVAVQVTVVFPNGKLAGASFDVTALVQLSIATGVPKLAMVAVQLLSAETVISEGATRYGPVLSLTVTACVVVAIFPEASVTVHVTMVVPN